MSLSSSTQKWSADEILNSKMYYSTVTKCFVSFLKKIIPACERLRFFGIPLNFHGAERTKYQHVNHQGDKTCCFHLKRQNNNFKKNKKKLTIRNTITTPQNTQWAAGTAVHENPLKTNTNLEPFVLGLNNSKMWFSIWPRPTYHHPCQCHLRVSLLSVRKRAVP